MEKITTGQELKEFRKELGLSQNEMAKILGIDRKCIVYAEIKHPKRNLTRKMKYLVNRCYEWHKHDEPKKTVWQKIKGLFGIG